MRYLLFFLAEWGNLYVIGAIVTTLFLGGWQVPPVTDAAGRARGPPARTFFLKAYFFVFIAMWIRATLPRVRVDQLMTLCWKYMVPIALVNVVGTAIWMVAMPPALGRVIAIAMTLGGAVVVMVFFRRVRFHLQRARLTAADYYYSPII
jgi:NADH-quinone oxidoreductase subunit H